MDAKVNDSGRDDLPYKVCPATGNRIYDLKDADVRKWLSPSANRAFCEMMNIWNIGNRQAARILGVYPYQYERIMAHPEHVVLSEQSLRVVATLLDIVDAIYTIFPRDVGDDWMRYPNTGWPFKGRAPAGYMAQYGHKGVTRVLGYFNPK